MKTFKYDGVDEEVYYEKLDNGLEVYMYPSDKAKKFYITINVKYGSVHTKYKIDGKKDIIELPHGTAHFLEHQMFQMDTHAAFEDFARLGSSTNAYTTYEYTCYEAIASDNFKENLDLLIDVVTTPVFKSDSVKSERGIITEEIRMYDDNPNAKSAYGLEYNLNVEDNHKYLISGTEDDIKKINPNVLYSTYETFYHPSNMFIVITGKFKPLEAVGIIKEKMNSREYDEPKDVKFVKKSEPAKVDVPYEEVSMNVSSTKVRLAYKIPKNAFKEYDDLTLRMYLHMILKSKFGAASDTLERMTNENLIIYDIYAYPSIRDDYVALSFAFETDYKDEAICVIKETLSSMKVTREEVERHKRVYTSNFIMHFDDVISMCEDIQDDVLNNGRIVTDILDYNKSLNEKTANDIISKIDLSNECIYIINREDQN